MSKENGGLVCVQPSAIAAVDQYGVNHSVLKSDTAGASWANIEPTQGTYDWSSIHAVLNAYPNVKFALRIQSGDYAPQWLKDLTGTVPLTLQARPGVQSVVHHWWEPVAMDAWRDMITAAGAEFDDNPQIYVVSADGPMVYYSEPWILGSSNTNAGLLWNAGLRLANHVAAIKRCVDDTAAAFPKTLVELAIHDTLQYPASATNMGFSWAAGRDQICIPLIETHGKHIVFTDYGIGTLDTLAAHPLTGTIYTEPDVYAWMRLRANGVTGNESWVGPVGYQLTLNGHTQPEDYLQAAQNCLDMGGQWAETSGWGSMLNGATNIPAFDAAFKAAAEPYDPPPPASSLEPVGVFTGGNDGGTSNVTAQSLTLPVAAAVGDVAIVMSTAFSTTATATIASGSAQGWTLLSGPDASFAGSNYREYLWSRVLTAEDIGSAVVVTWTAQLAGLAVGVVYPAGCTIGSHGFATVAGGSSAITPTGVAATAGDALLLFVTAKANSGATPASAILPSTATSDKVSTTASVAGTNFGTVAAHQPINIDGTAGTTPISFSGATNGASAYTLVISPPVSLTGIQVYLRSGGSWVAKRLVRVP